MKALRRPTIVGMLALIGLWGLSLAALRSGSNAAFESIYGLTFLGLVCTTIAARSRGPLWYGVAVAGWAYFVVGFGPWIDYRGGNGRGAVNRNLGSSVLIKLVVDMVEQSNLETARVSLVGALVPSVLRANREGIAHCALTVLFALVGGLVSRRLARTVPGEDGRPAEGSRQARA